VTGASKIFEGLASVEDVSVYRQALTIGLYELLGSLGTAAVLTMFQLILWSAARRRTS